MRKTMKKSGAPAKRLAPTLAPGICCPHEFTGLEGLQLEVDCETCGGAQDLMNKRCLVGIVNVVVRGAVPDKIILKRFMHKRYRNEPVLLVAMAASELSTLTRALASASAPSDRKCRTCACGPKRLITEMRDRLLEDPQRYVRDRRLALAVIDKALAGLRCDKGRECADQARMASTLLQGRPA